MNDHREGYSVIEDDMLVRHIPVPDNPILWKKEPVLTKEEFILCYRKWILGRLV